MSVFLITGNYSTIALVCIFQHTELNVFSLLSTSLHENASPTQASVLHQVLVPTQRSYDTLAPTRLDPGRRFLPARLLGCFCHVCMTLMGIITMLIDHYATIRIIMVAIEHAISIVLRRLKSKAYLLSCWDLSPQVETFSLFFA